MKTHLILLILPLFFACTSVKPEFGAAGDYFPEPYWLQQGIVNKYHYHFDQGEGYDPSTNIHYRSYQLIDSNKLLVCQYDPAMALVQSSTYQFEDQHMQLLEESRYLRADTLHTEVIQAGFANWRGQQDTLHEKKRFLSGAIQEVFQYQQSIQDTILFSQRKAKTISREQTTINYIPDRDPQEYHSQLVSTYVQGIGLFGYELTYENGVGRLELIQQIPLKTFEEMAQHAVKRVAYIDPDSVLDTDNVFKPCEAEAKIVDYYNGEPDGAIVGGKKALWELIEEQLQPEKLRQESGYLTFRFVINCEGQAGWFVTEEADLNYQRKVFAADTRDHLLEILYHYPQWQACEIQDQARDSYAYITFILKDGQITELLP
ncbi:MAG: hypothetical protein AAF587_35255 [Bacteroidota bacterium]